MSLESNGQHPDVLGRQDVLASIRSSTSTRRSVYLTINPDLTVHKAYKQSLLEHERIAFTRLRLGSHRLRIETGRWSRLPREERGSRSFFRRSTSPKGHKSEGQHVRSTISPKVHKSEGPQVRRSISPKVQIDSPPSPVRSSKSVNYNGSNIGRTCMHRSRR